MASTFISVTSAAVSTGLAAFGAGRKLSGDPPAYTPSVHTLFLAGDGGLSWAAASRTASEAAIAAVRVQTTSTARAGLISVLLFRKGSPRDFLLSIPGFD